VIDFDFNLRMKRRSVAAFEHGAPRTPGIRKVLVVAALVVLLTFARLVLGVSPSALMGMVT